MKKLIVLTIFAIMTLSFASCSDGEGASDTNSTLPSGGHSVSTETTTVKVLEGHEEIVGKWIAESATANGESIDVATELPPDQCFIRILGDGTGELSSITMYSTMRYTFDGSKLVITALGESRTYVYANDKLTYSYASDSGTQVEYVYVKADPSTTTTTTTTTAAQ